MFLIFGFIIFSFIISWKSLIFACVLLEIQLFVDL